MHRIAIFASGSGSNAVSIIKFFQSRSDVEVALIVCNKADAGILTRVEAKDIPKLIVSNAEVREGSELVRQFQNLKITFIVLAGFLRKIPDVLVAEYTNRIVNIHPALLPKYGGKGMYGKHVHQAVFEDGENESGPTIHFVNAHYDEGNIIFQVATDIRDCQTPEDIAAKVLKLEHYYYPIIINQVLTQTSSD